MGDDTLYMRRNGEIVVNGDAVMPDNWTTEFTIKVRGMRKPTLAAVKAQLQKQFEVTSITEGGSVCIVR